MSHFPALKTLVQRSQRTEQKYLVAVLQFDLQKINHAVMADEAEVFAGEIEIAEIGEIIEEIIEIGATANGEIIGATANVTMEIVEITTGATTEVVEIITGATTETVAVTEAGVTIEHNSKP